MQLFIEIVCSVLILIGSLFMLISSIGIIRLPDFYIRNSASTKAVVLGLAFILFGVGIYFNNILIFLEVIVILFFISLIMPLSAHIIARAACKTNVPFWKNTDLREMKGYNKDAVEGKKENAE
jgi:multicomponent Na+:H+ antiporter subunit G